MTATLGRRRILQGAAGLAALGFPSAALAGEPPVELRRQDGTPSCVREVWRADPGLRDLGKPGTRFFAEHWGTEVRGDVDALRVAPAPDGLPAVERRVRAGTVEGFVVWGDQLGRPGAQAARASVDIWWEAGFRYPREFTGGKLALGLWGGEITEAGTPADAQPGWYDVLMLHGRPHNEVGAGIGLYSYHLNRREPVSGGAQYGQGMIGEEVSIPTGRWVRVEHEIILDRPGRTDGVTRLRIDGRLVLERFKITFRRDFRWGIRGIHLLDMWGGRPEDPRNQSPRDQRIWYRDWRLWAGGGEPCGLPPAEKLPAMRPAGERG
ncbi:hypothetical protein SH611_14085 [Geminicoccaceae bacterium 1502E]|nr:hypothetical protein [Geminicoccaceae bacterium 1502E]